MRLVSAGLFFTVLFSVFISCNKEKSFEVGAPAVGSLKSDATGDCLPKTAVGAFIAGNSLSDSNYLEVEVNVASEGAYTIRTDTINGYSFTGTGNFTQTGINRIRLLGSGTPQSAGSDAFSVIFDTSFCFVPVTVLPAGSSSGPATLTLQGSGDSCMSAAISGAYVQNTPVTSSNTVAIKVNATTTGTYTVTTDTKNGFYFSGSGTIATTGEQTITLTASGTPATKESTVFTVSTGGTTCNFSVNVTASDVPPPVATSDLFPLAPNSRWSYFYNPNAPDDTIQVTNVGTMTFDGKTYQNFEYTDAAGAYDSLFYRKSDSDYYQYVVVNELIPSLETDVRGDILFLKGNPGVGDTWTTDFPTTIGGEEVSLRFSASCTAANTSIAQDGKNYTGVYKVATKLQVGKGGVYTDSGPVIESFYAKGIGLIYEKANENAGNFERHIRNYEIK